MPDQLPEYRIASKTVPIILFAARAGSTYSGQLVARHPAFGRVAEWFNPPRLERLRTEYGFQNDAEAVQYLLDREARQLFGTECTLYGLTSCALLGFLDQILPRARFIMLKRRDRVAHAVSLTKAQLTGQFSSNQTPRMIATADDYDADKIASNLRIIASVYAQLEAFLEAVQADPLTVYYEDIVNDPAAFQSQIFRYLNITPTSVPSQKTSVQKIADAVNAAWIERFRREA
ncbi:hypothetical protein HFP51_00710 [Parasphingopyxis sp. CP4]|uniref:Stf0 family sulfotransferase n=1 Tax=Parasphingopyxis sp. CP4 TaxID=2724527 RepID=UPI0015A12FA7|nr:Stf0 family sulfotransferase [Parasphingopyxis sp. CP4]QLC20834.1 hypothetical protein HFP51_00710 [Parasphingopyxis sp. CP4]